MRASRGLGSGGICRQQRLDAAGAPGGGAAQVDDLGRIGAVRAAGGAAAGEAGSGARSRALAAVETAAAVGHRRLAAAGAGTRLGAAARGRQVVAGGVVVLEAPPA